MFDHLSAKASRSLSRSRALKVDIFRNFSFFFLKNLIIYENFINDECACGSLGTVKLSRRAFFDEKCIPFTNNTSHHRT